MCVDRGLLDVYSARGALLAAVRRRRQGVRRGPAPAGRTPPACPVGTSRPPWRTSYDWVPSAARLAAQAPWWEPGTASGYHALNQGHLVGEVVRRVTGRSLKDFVADEIAGPLGADFQIGAREQTTDASLTVVPPPPLAFDLDSMDPTSPVVRTFTGPADRPVPSQHRRLASAPTSAPPTVRATPARSPGSCRSLSLGRPGRRRAVALAGDDRADLRRAEPRCRPRARASRSGSASATALPDTETPPVPSRRANVCFWGGWGGSLVITDLDRRMTIAYMMNKMAAGIVGSDRSELYVRTVTDCLG